MFEDTLICLPTKKKKRNKTKTVDILYTVGVPEYFM